jgi:hypothetical protein
MSGDYITKENIIWLNATQANVAPFRFFQKWVQYINSKPNFTVLGYGTGASQTGTTLPSSWLLWDGVTAPPFSDQDWFVFRADKASTLLNGNGNYQWEAKIQVANTNGVALADCSGSPYGLTDDQTVAIRCAPHGGWAGPGTLDFVPTDGSDISNNYAMYYEDGLDFYLHILGDDDTIRWAGIAGPLDYDFERGGSIGMVNPRDSETGDPFVMIVGRVCVTAPSTGRLAKFAKGPSTSDHFYTQTSRSAPALGWPAFMLDKDGLTGKTAYKICQLGDDWARNCGKYRYTTPNKDLLWQMRIGIWEAPDSYQIVGGLRYISAINGSRAEGVVFGANADQIQLSNSTDAASHGGIAVKWPAGVAPAW